MSELLQRAAERVQDSMDEILTNFKGDAKITVLVRTPGKPTADFCMTSDDLNEVIAMVQRRKDDAPAPQNSVRQLDWSNFAGPKRNTEWKPDDQDLIYTAINFRDNEWGDADEDAGQQIVERLLQAWQEAEMAAAHYAHHRRELLDAVQPAPQPNVVVDEYVVWSNEHKCWWGPNRAGYVGRIADAGRYTREDALKICVGARGGRQFNANPSEVPLLLADAERFWPDDQEEWRIARHKAKSELWEDEE